MEEDLTPLGYSGISDSEVTNGSQEQSGPQFSPDDNGREQEEDAGFQDRLDSTEQQLEQKEQATTTSIWRCSWSSRSKANSGRRTWSSRREWSTQ